MWGVVRCISWVGGEVGGVMADRKKEKETGSEEREGRGRKEMGELTTRFPAPPTYRAVPSSSTQLSALTNASLLSSSFSLHSSFSSFLSFVSCPTAKSQREQPHPPRRTTSYLHLREKKLVYPWKPTLRAAQSGGRKRAGRGAGRRRGRRGSRGCGMRLGL